MTNPFFDGDSELTNEQIRLQELLRQIINLSSSDDYAGRIILQDPDGEFVGDIKVGARDIEVLTDGLMAINTYRHDAEDQPAGPLPIDEEDIAAIGDEAEAFLKDGGLL